MGSGFSDSIFICNFTHPISLAMTSLPAESDNGTPATMVDSSSNISSSERQIDPSIVLPLRMTSVVVKGYGRGSKQLGIPTANLDRVMGKFGCSSSSSSSSSSSTTTQQLSSFDDLPTGIYWGFCRIGHHPHVYKTA
jgi:FAD synthase